jgi:hypothetical protein
VVLGAIRKLLIVCGLYSEQVISSHVACSNNRTEKVGHNTSDGHQ